MMAIVCIIRAGIFCVRLMKAAVAIVEMKMKRMKREKKYLNREYNTKKNYCTQDYMNIEGAILEPTCSRGSVGRALG